MTVEQQIWTFLRDAGFNEYGTAGIMGNLSAESGLNPHNLQNSYEKKLNMTDAEYTEAVDSGRYTNFAHDSAGYGLAQWTYWSRKQGLYNYTKSRKLSIGDLQGQLEFLLQELKQYKGIKENVMEATSVKQASDFIVLNFERPASVAASASQIQRETTLNKRTTLGQQFYNKYTSFLPEGGNKMKYNENNKPLQCMLTTNPCYKKGDIMQIKGILWHDTGCNNPTLKRYVQPPLSNPNYQEWMAKLGTNMNNNDWGHTTSEVGVNAFIGKLADGTITTIQVMPWNYRPWGCGGDTKGSCNDGWIQFEICEDNMKDKKYFDAIYQEGIELTAYLCKLYNIDPTGTVKHNGVIVPTILCHQDSHKLKLGSNHSDIYDWFTRYGKSMETVRKDVAALLEQEEEDTMTQEQFDKMMENYLTRRANQPTTGDWEVAALKWATDLGIMQGGTNNNLMPKSFPTRAEVATLLQRLYAKIGK